jgi:hypothetical protein
MQALPVTPAQVRCSAFFPGKEAMLRRGVVPHKFLERFSPDAALLDVALALYGTSANMRRGSSERGCADGEMT